MEQKRSREEMARDVYIRAGEAMVGTTAFISFLNEDPHLSIEERYELCELLDKALHVKENPIAKKFLLLLDTLSHLASQKASFQTLKEPLEDFLKNS